MNQAKIWYGTLNKRLLKWDSSTSVEDLEDSIRRFVTQHNDVWAHPCTWYYNGVPD